MAAPRPFVEFDRVSLTYGEGESATAALDATTLSIEQGEFIAVVGPSGCGKSSLLKLVSGLLRASGGNVVVAGQEVTAPIKIVGMAFQNPNLLPWRSTLRNVLLPAEIVQPHRAQYRRDKRPYVERARGLLRTVGLEGFEEKLPWQLSGGMQQRTSLCRALMHEPELLLLDEPFGALDAFTREELWAVLQALWMQRRFTVVLVTHDLREALYLADTIYVMSARPGRILLRRRFDLPRPRSLESTYDPRFVAALAELRSHIAEARTPVPAFT
ncbi:ABC transporter ATP-binding protein [Falsiroseomonas sp.]|uniref:ABC transporter ATP-binding protein n=1 Tax=Falsiroseomonas sp. TaxID=2870721 RepID=UPI003F6FE794